MKTTLCAIILMLGSFTSPAHDEVWVDEFPNSDAVTYEVPVVYHAPVVYQAAVVYNAPVFYLTPTVQSGYWAAADYPTRSPNVIIVGGPSYYTSWETTPNVVIIGRSPTYPRVTPARCWR